MRQRRLLYLASFDPTAAGSGSSARARLVLDALSRRYETHVVHLRSPHERRRDEALAGRLASLTAVEYSRMGYFVGSPALLWTARNIVASRGIDFAFAEFEKAGEYARRLGVPFLYASHNVEFRRSLGLARANPVRLALVPWLYLLERRACRGALTTFAISDEDAQVFRRWTPNVRVLPMAFDEEVFHPFYEEQSGPRVVLMVGNFDYAASREAAFWVRNRLMPAVRNRHPGAVFRFVGGGLPGGFSGLGIEAPGFIEDLAAEYRQAGVVVAPIVSGGGIKIKVIEALAMGRFLVATPKALEGIGAEGLEHLAVAPLERFAAEVSAAIERRPGRSEANWARISEQFGARAGRQILLETIEEALER
jgi:glycosyltransferase involved in cell wall biosynthesis